MRTITTYNLKSLTYFNKVKLTVEEKEFAETESKLSRDLLRYCCYSIQKKPRNLQYSFVTDLFNDNCLDKTFMSQTSKSNLCCIKV